MLKRTEQFCSNKVFIGEKNEMKVVKSFLILTIAILGFSMVNVDAQDVSKDGNANLQQLEKQVLKKIVYTNNYGVFDNIKFQIEGNTVILTGKVYSLGTSSRAENRVKRVKGVGNVVNNIEILSGSSFDNRIRRQTVRSFANTGGIARYLVGPRPSMRIIVENGHLTLEGFVTSEGDSRLASILAKGVSGTFTVTNNLVVTKNKRY